LLPFVTLARVCSYYTLSVKAVPICWLVTEAGTMLLEVKDGSKPPSAQKLTPQQEIWHRDWRGHRVVVNSPEAALGAIRVISLSWRYRVKRTGGERVWQVLDPP
jgi:hypothetical protein